MRTIKATDARFLVVSVVRTGYGEATSVDSTVCKCETRLSFSGGLLLGAIVADIGAVDDEGVTKGQIQKKSDQIMCTVYVYY
jgi:hypothetical protein